MLLGNGGAQTMRVQWESDEPIKVRGVPRCEPGAEIEVSADVGTRLLEGTFPHGKFVKVSKRTRSSDADKE